MTARATRVRRREAERSERNRIRAGVTVERWQAMTSGQRSAAVDRAKKNTTRAAAPYRVSAA
jgi:hypothetical protein